jgi:hypothetical protein
VGASERDEFLRSAWRALVAGHIDAKRLVFVDEMGSNTSLAPLYACSRRGERALAKTPRNWGSNLTLLASMSAEGMGSSLVVEGATTRGVFEAYLELVLAPSLWPGQVVVMDNLSAHKGGRVREIVESRGCELLYLPPYSPDLNPIERGPSPSSKLACARWRLGAARLSSLIEAMGVALDGMSPSDAHGFFEHCGYRTPAQSL